jgi:hypothetical protein
MRMAYDKLSLLALDMNTSKVLRFAVVASPMLVATVNVLKLLEARPYAASFR